VVYLESGYLQLLWIGGIPLLVIYLWLVRQVWCVGAEVGQSAGPWGACGRAAQICWAMVAVLSLLDPHVTLRGTGDLLFVLLAIIVGQAHLSAPASRPRRGSPGRAARRLRDLAIAVPVLVVLGLPMLLVAAAIRLTSREPALFRQVRVGLGGRPFTMYKFRTMITGGDDGAHRELIRAELRGEDTVVAGSTKLVDPRVTALGALLRRTSIDELPQLLNVVRGDMSLVGPRPCLDWEAAMFPLEYAARFDVLPGITGLWQVSGRATLGTLDMLALDVDYAVHRSLGVDMLIIARTLRVLLRGDGAR